MNTKLTLSIDQHVILEAKRYARVHSTSVSKMVEQFLDEVTSSKEIGLTGTVAELAGVIPESDNDYCDFLAKKYQ